MRLGKIRCLTGALILAAASAGIWGCSTDTELGGATIPNSRPDTRITGQPPTLLEAGFAANFNWTGSDPDGRVVGYEWKISNNGLDGISPRDTLTIDPLTGGVINPWRFTAGNDSTFLVLSDLADFPPDTLQHNQPRSYRSHSLFIRAVDDKGAVDPTPAYMSFTSTTLVPTCRAVYPGLSDQAPKTVPPTVNFKYSGDDPDFNLRIPTRARFLWIPAIDPNGNPIQTAHQYNLYYDQIINFDDPQWSPWSYYPANELDRKVPFKDQPNGDYFLFAVQVEDTAGAVSVGLGYQIEVGHVKIKTGFFRPEVQLFEPFLGFTNQPEIKDEIAGGQPLNFSWTADASSYNGEIVSYRHGYDLVNPDNPNDPGWAVPPGLSDQNLYAAETSFPTGSHIFYLRVEDDSGQVNLFRWYLTVIPFVDYNFQFPLRVIDQVVDVDNRSWPDASGNFRNDESYRNPFWHFLADGAGGVTDINWERDWIDHTSPISFSDLVNYKVVLCYAKTGQGQLMFQDFRAVGGVDKFVWMASYQKQGGNLFLVGHNSMDSFLEIVSNYMTPIVFDTRETFFYLRGQQYVTGFGSKELPDGTSVERGPLQYPYATAGISALDWTATNSKFVFNRNRPVRYDRNVDCNGLKGVVLDGDFKDQHLIGPGVVADTMWTEKAIDWYDETGIADGSLRLFDLTFPFRDDEFTNSNISGTRTTPIVLQECADGVDGMCVEPMFRGISRFDWLREYRYAHGEPDWPYNRYSRELLTNYDGCGPLSLTGLSEGDVPSARTNGLVYGYFSYKVSADKPIPGSPDVYWGFDPYRFDHEQSKKAIRWVLQTLGLQINQ